MTSDANRLVQVAHVLPWGAIGGVEQGALRIANAIRSEGISSVAFCAGRGPPVPALFGDAGHEAVEYEPAEPSYLHPRDYLRSSLRLAREFRRRRIDLVHCQDLLAGYHAGLAARLARIPVICHVRCEYPSISRRDRSFLRMLDHFVFVSRRTYEVFDGRVPRRNATVLYDGIDLQGDVSQDSAAAVREEFFIPSTAPLLGMVARIAPVKDYETLIAAASRVLRAFPEARFLVVGDTEGASTYRAHFERVRQSLEEAGIRDRFIFTGFRTDVSRLIAAMDISLLVTHSEGVPLVVLEAMARGRPVIATDVGGIPEVVTDGETGLLHRHGDAEHLSSQILRLLRDPAEAARLGRAGSELIRTRFNVTRFRDELVDLYRRILRLAPAAGDLDPVVHPVVNTSPAI